MPLHDRPDCGRRIAIPCVTKALIVSGEPKHLLESETRPAGLSLGSHEEEVAAGFEHPNHFAEECLVVLDVLQEVDGCDDIKGRSPKRQLGIAGLENPVTNQLLGRPYVISLEIGADPGTAALP